MPNITKSKTYVAILVFAQILLGGCEDSAGPDPATRTESVDWIVVEGVQFSNELTRIEAVGTSRAVKSVSISPSVSGEVVAVNFEPGQQVKEGNVLVELDSRRERLALELAEVRARDAERLYQRYQKTDGTGATLPTAIDAARTAQEVARIELDRAAVALDDRIIRASFSGYVGITDVDTGDRVGPDTVITTLDNRDSLLVSFQVPEIMVGKIRTGDMVNISSWADKTAGGRGDIVDIGSRIDPVTRTFPVRARVDNSDDELRPGMSFRVSMDLQGRSYPLIPEIAVQWGAEGSFVWAVYGARVKRVYISIIQRQEGYVLADGGLARGDLIVVEGVQRMHEGLEVSYQRVPSDIEYDEIPRDINISS